MLNSPFFQVKGRPIHPIGPANRGATPLPTQAGFRHTNADFGEKTSCRSARCVIDETVKPWSPIAPTKPLLWKQHLFDDFCPLRDWENNCRGNNNNSSSSSCNNCNNNDNDNDQQQQQPQPTTNNPQPTTTTTTNKQQPTTNNQQQQQPLGQRRCAKSYNNIDIV